MTEYVDILIELRLRFRCFLSCTNRTKDRKTTTNMGDSCKVRVVSGLSSMDVGRRHFTNQAGTASVMLFQRSETSTVVSNRNKSLRSHNRRVIPFGIGIDDRDITGVTV